MFNIGFSEMLIIAVIALIFIGPKQLPELARTLGRLIGEFRKATDDLTGTFTGVRDSAEKYMNDQTKSINDAIHQNPSYQDLSKNGTTGSTVEPPAASGEVLSPGNENQLEFHLPQDQQNHAPLFEDAVMTYDPNPPQPVAVAESIQTQTGSPAESVNSEPEISEMGAAASPLKPGGRRTT